jgi:FKBP-type peptidyl-prolyl cis-trans isomerase SlyD
MTGDALRVSDDMIVAIAYQLHLDDGELVDEATPDEPFAYIQGQSQLMPALEHALDGMSVGESRKVTVKPDEAFGDVDEGQVVELTWDDLPDDLELAEGDVLDVEDAESGETMAATVIRITDDGVVMDLNHPLAGETLHFSVQIMEVRSATDEELAHGHVHGAGHHH